MSLTSLTSLASLTLLTSLAHLALAVVDEGAAQLRVLDGVGHHVVPHGRRLEEEGALLSGLAGREVIDLWKGGYNSNKLLIEL